MTTDSATAIIYRWASITNWKLFIFLDRREEIVPYLQAVDEIQWRIDYTDSEDERKEAESVIRIAMSRLAEEFRSILKVHANVHVSLKPDFCTDSTTMTDSVSSNYEVYEDEVDKDDYVKSMSAEAINVLRSIALRMNYSGFLHECLKVYVSERRSFIGALLQHLKVEKLCKNSCRRLEWTVLESKIIIWIKAAKICFGYYFQTEKWFCDMVFYDLGDETVDNCLMDTVSDHAIQLLDTAEAFSSIHPAFERLFKILDLINTLSHLIPSINGLFHSHSSEFLRTRVVNQIMPKLADKANKILLNFENALVNDQSPVVDAEPINWLSKYMMNFVYKLCKHKITLMILLLCNPPSMGAAGSSIRRFSLYVVWIITSLVSNLEVKSKLCKDRSASRFFAMNNFHYIIQKIQAHPELLENVADDSLNKLIDKFEQAKSDYLKLTFDVALKNLRYGGLNKIRILSFRATKLEHRLERFNSEFEKLEKDLWKVVVPDSGLVLELRKLIVEMVVTAYTSFLVHIKKEPSLGTYVKYSVEDIESVIQGFYVCR